MSHSFCKINKFKGWINGGLQMFTHEEVNPFAVDVVKFNQKKG